MASIASANIHVRIDRIVRIWFLATTAFDFPLLLCFNTGCEVVAADRSGSVGFHNSSDPGVRLIELG